MSFHLAITSWGIYLTEIEAQVRIMHIRIVILAFLQWQKTENNLNVPQRRNC